MFYRDVANNSMCGDLPSYLYTSTPPYLITDISGNRFSCPMPSWCINNPNCSPCVYYDSCALTPTPTPTYTQTNTSTTTPTFTPTNLISSTPANTPPNTPARTISFSLSPTKSVSFSSSNTPTISESNTLSFTQSGTPTNTPTPTKSPIISQTLQLLGPSYITPASTISTNPTVNFGIISPSVSSKYIFPLDFRCINNCEYGNIQGDISPNSVVPLTTDNDELIGNIYFSNIEGFLDASFVTNLNSMSIGNSIVDINIFDLSGNLISKLPDTLKICLAEEKTNEDVCLSFFNTRTEKWECQDKCLTREDDQYCGTTDHLTSFALLLDGGGNGGGGCGSSDEDYVFAWISLALIIIAIIIVIVSVVINEIRFRFIYQRKKRIMSLMAGTAECYEELNYSDY